MIRAALAADVLAKMKAGDVMVPSPLVVDSNGRLNEPEQKLLTRYYLECGAGTVIPGTHTGQFARGDIGLYRRWLELNGAVIDTFGDPRRTFKMAAVGGANAFAMLEAAAAAGCQVVMVAPTAFVDRGGRLLAEPDALKMLDEMSRRVPVFGFYLQQAVGGRDFSGEFWSGLFDIACGAKAAPFSRPKTDLLMRAALASGRVDELVLVTGNDDYIVGDLLSAWTHPHDPDVTLRFSAGLLGHFASDTHAAVNLVRVVKKYREEQGAGGRPPSAGMVELAGAVTAMNYALFDTAELPGSPPFDSCVYGVHYRLVRLGILPAVTDIRWTGGAGAVRHEKGRPGLEREIDAAYGARPELTDESFLDPDTIERWRGEVHRL